RYHAIDRERRGAEEVQQRGGLLARTGKDFARSATADAAIVSGAVKTKRIDAGDNAAVGKRLIAVTALPRKERVVKRPESTLFSGAQSRLRSALSIGDAACTVQRYVSKGNASRAHAPDNLIHRLVMKLSAVRAVKAG